MSRLQNYIRPLAWSLAIIGVVSVVWALTSAQGKKSPPGSDMATLVEVCQDLKILIPSNWKVKEVKNPPSDPNSGITYEASLNKQQNKVLNNRGKIQLELNCYQPRIIDKISNQFKEDITLPEAIDTVKPTWRLKEHESVNFNNISIDQQQCARAEIVETKEISVCTKRGDKSTGGFIYEIIKYRQSGSADSKRLDNVFKSITLKSNLPSKQNRNLIFNISGTVNLEKNTGKLDYAFRYAEPPRIEFNIGDYSIELLGTSDEVLSRQSFQPMKASHGNIGGFSLHVPARDGVVAVRLVHGSKILDELRPGGQYPEIKISPLDIKHLPTSGEFKFSWLASDPDGDTLQYMIRMSSDNGQTWRNIGSGLPQPLLSLDVSRLPKSSGTLFQVLASDGINTSADTIGPFIVAGKKPTVTIATPDGGVTRFGEPVILIGSGDDPEEGNIPNERLVWSSDTEGVLGKGQTLQLDKGLTNGKHTITLIAEDKDGNKGSASIVIVSQ